MSFDGPALSFDDEGSILFDGEKIIVNVPAGHELLEHIGADEDIPFPVVYTHPSHQQNQQTSTEQSAEQTPDSDSGGQGGTAASQAEIRPPATTLPPAILVPPDLLDISEDAVGSLEQHIAALNSGQSTSGFPQDIEWSPEDEASGLDPFIQAAAAGTRDSSEDKTTVVCEALYAADPEGVARGVKLMTGAELDNEEDVLGECIRLARSVGLDEYLASVEGWYTTRLGPSESFAAAATGEEPLSGLSQPPADASADEAPEINILAQHYLSETESGWDRTWTEKEHLENVVLIPKLKRFIHGFDENSVNWGDFTLLESLDFFARQMAGELMALSQNPAASDEYYKKIHAELDWATELQSLAEPKALDYTEVYAESVAWTVHVPDAEHERRHVVDQLALIHEELNIFVPDKYFESRSTRELKHDLAYLLQDEVLPFLNADENEEDNRIGDFYHHYQLIARDKPEYVLRRLVSSYQKPDVVGFFFMMGFLAVNILYEPIDWITTSVDVTDALLRGDKESAKQHLFFGAVPFLKSGMVRVMKRLGRSPLGRLMPARLARIDSTLLSRDELRRLGFSDEAIEIFEYRGGTGPGSGSNRHRRWEELGYESRSAVTIHGENAGTKIQDENAQILNERYGFNIVNEPDPDLLEEIGFNDRTTLDGGPIGGERTPDYIIEGRDFDSYQVGANDPETVPPKTAIRRIWNTIEDKVPDQTNGLVIDLSKTSLTAERFIIDELSTYSQPKLGGLREIIFMDNGEFAGNWVNPQG